MLRRRTKRKLLAAGIVFTAVFAIAVAGASAGGWGGGWLWFWFR